jgi:hypothetical protein
MGFLNLGERISVVWRGSVHSDGNRSRRASRRRCASDTRPRIRRMLSGGRVSLSMPRSHRRSQRFSMEATSSSNSAISPCITASNIRACATSAGCAGRAHASVRWRTGTGARRGRGTHVGVCGSKATSRGIESTPKSSPRIGGSATPQVHRPVEFRWLGVTVHSLSHALLAAAAVVLLSATVAGLLRFGFPSDGADLWPAAMPLRRRHPTLESRA